MPLIMIVAPTPIELSATVAATILRLAAAILPTPLVAALVAGDQVFPAVVQTDTGWTLLATNNTGLPIVATVDDEDPGPLLLLLSIGGDLIELKARVGINKGGEWHRVLEDLGMGFELATKPIDELQGEVMIIDGAADGNQIVIHSLEPTSIDGDGQVTARRASKCLAEEEVVGHLVVEEEAIEPRLGRARAVVGVADQAVQIVGESPHEP
jgi:hypothetical protein